MATPKARELIEAAAKEIYILPNPFLDLLEDGRVPHDRLRWIAGEQHWILRADQRALAALAARFPDPPAGELFLSLSGGEIQARRLLAAYGDAVGADEEYLRRYEPRPMAQAYPAFVAWSVLNGTLSGIALAMLANLPVWGAYCARAADVLVSRYDLTENQVAFFRFFSRTPPGFEDQAAAAMRLGLDAGEDPATALHMARAMHAYELAFWQALAEDL